MLFDEPFLAKLKQMSIGIILATEDFLDFEEATRISTRLGSVLSVGLGFHPKNYTYFEQFSRILFDRMENVDIISEIGLDKNSKCPMNQQETYLYEMLSNLSSTHIIQFHSPSLSSSILDILSSFHFKKVIFHRFNGTMNELERIIDQGYFISVNVDDIPALSRNNLIQNCPLSQILTETDFPYCKNKNYLTILPKLIEKIAQIKNRCKDEIRTTIKTTINNILVEN
jgi:TatD DNase family protein